MWPFSKKNKKDSSQNESGRNVYDLRSASEKQIENSAKNPLQPDLEKFAEEILNAFEQGYFDDDSRNSSNPVYWDADYKLKGALRDKAERINVLAHLQQVYYRVSFLAQNRGINIVERCISVLFDGIADWMD